MPGRRFSDGLHQALEAKEGVTIHPENRTLATISFQNFFNKYEKKCGMTGTAITEEQEFRDIYSMDVVTIPTNRPKLRKDLDDRVYKTKKEKYAAIVAAVEKAHKKGQPVLVGTTTIDVSEHLSRLFTRHGIEHHVLNAKNPEKEAEIVADAGKFGAVTIATNMAGRGTDIKLDEKSREAGGLYVIGTERHESRRIDNQLRGRSGRQGDPGESQFYLSLEDDLMRLFGGERMQAMMSRLTDDEDMPIESKMISRTVESSQKKVEGRNFGIRKNTLQYDDVMNRQRELIYKQRDQVLDGIDLTEKIRGMLETNIAENVGNYCSGETQADWNIAGLKEKYKGWLTTDEDFQNVDELTVDDVVNTLTQRGLKRLEEKRELIGDEMFTEFQRMVLLRNVDVLWMDHIDAMDDLKQGIHLRAYAQRDPVVEFRLQSYDMFDEMTAAIRENTVRMLLTLVPRRREDVERKAVAKVTATSAGGDDTATHTTVRKGKKVGPNDPCPCGSGKKYKKCCGAPGKEKPTQE